MKLYDGREKFYQYDTNQKLICEDCAVGEEIHFSNSAHGDAAICLTYDLDGAVVVNVPNLYLLSAVEMNVYSMRTEDDGRCTISRHVFGVVPRKKPSDYVYEETEVKSYAELDRRIKKLEENDGAGIDLTGAAVGQVAQIAEVDKNGAPTKWHPADLPAVSAMTGATADADGVSGVVPAPAAGDEGKFLRGDGTWGDIDIPEGGGGGGGISQDELQAAVNAAVEQAKAGLLVFEDSYVDNTANWLTNGYTKVSQTATIGQPSQCTGADKWGVIFFIAENAANGTGTHMYFPIDGTYKGRVFTRSVTRRVPGEWHLLPTMNDIPASGGGGGTADHTLGLSGASVGQIAKITAVDGDGVPTAWESVNLPSGGGKTWRLIKRIELEEDVAKIAPITTDENGNQFDLESIRVLFRNYAIGTTSANSSGWARVWFSTRNSYSAERNDSILTNNAYIEPRIVDERSYAELVNYGDRQYYRMTAINDGVNGKLLTSFLYGKGNTIQRIALSTNNGSTVYLAAGCIIEIWGVDA